MLRWFRRHSSRVGALTLLALVGMGASLGAPHAADCHDAACDPAAVSHDASAHVFRSADPGTDDAHPLHCLVCHWVRSFRPRTEIRFVSAPALDAGVRVHVEFFTVAPSTTVAQPALRSPPPIA